MFCSLKRGPAISSPNKATRMPPITATIMEVCTAFWTVSSSLLPTALAITTFVPSEMPRNPLIMKLIIGVFAPTAAMQASPSSPVKFPTTAISAALKACCRIPVIAKGKANPRILFQRLPSVMDSFLINAALMNSQSKSFSKPQKQTRRLYHLLGNSYNRKITKFTLQTSYLYKSYYTRLNKLLHFALVHSLRFLIAFHVLGVIYNDHSLSRS